MTVLACNLGYMVSRLKHGHKIMYIRMSNHMPLASEAAKRKSMKLIWITVLFQVSYANGLVNIKTSCFSPKTSHLAKIVMLSEMVVVGK